MIGNSFLSNQNGPVDWTQGDIHNGKMAVQNIRDLEKNKSMALGSDSLVSIVCGGGVGRETERKID